MGHNLSKKNIFWTGVLGAFAPQILRWYSQNTFDIGSDVDTYKFVGSLFITTLFLTLAGFVTMIWKVRDLKEAFLVGLAVPSIILSGGSDIRAIIEPRPTNAQEVGNLSVQAKTESDEVIPHIKITATDESKRTYSSIGRDLVLPSGTYTVVIENVGYEPESQQVIIKAKETSHLNVTLCKKSAIYRFFLGIIAPFE